MIEGYKEDYYLVFTINEIKLATGLSKVERVISAIETNHLPGAQKVIQGVINVAGQIIPIVNFRKRLHLTNKALTLSDKIIIVNEESTRLGFVVDEILDLKKVKKINIQKHDAHFKESDNLIEGIAIIDESIILIQNINELLSGNERVKLKTLLKKQESIN